MKNEKGQSTIEFLMGIIFVFGFLFLFLRVSITLTNGYLVHYATFMASRAYLVADNNSNQVNGADGFAFKQSEEVFASFRVANFISGFSGELEANSPEFGGNKVFVGLWVEYQDKFALNGLIGGGQKLTLRSESFLGREPTRAECLERVCAANIEVGGNCRVHSTLVDNGC